ncbi:MAG TPA: hypothetical protein ENG14_07010 [Thermodesulforhabdus norvegica]|uniref:Uncharacterized protein n=1 Tax=Thermodesulforhabdus norvegica TaxID=39841 RepID=A0A7C1AZA7_9BACT|nr:hypothetical protein [Thermodesulforhabdus norvegica]
MSEGKEEVKTISSQKAFEEYCKTKPKVKQCSMKDSTAFYVRAISAGDRDKLESTIMDKSGDYRSRVTLVCLSDEEGNRLYQDADFQRVRKLPAQVLSAVFHEGIAFNGMTGDEEDEEKRGND